jgi:hypothetical protein
MGDRRHRKDDTNSFGDYLPIDLLRGRKSLRNYAGLNGAESSGGVE